MKNGIASVFVTAFFSEFSSHYIVVTEFGGCDDNWFLPNLIVSNLIK